MKFVCHYRALEMRQDMRNRFRKVIIMRHEAWQTFKPDIEHGYPLCRTDEGELIPGNLTTGHRYGVTLETKCPRGKLKASFHTHPMGEALPSDADIREGWKYKMDVCIGVPQTGEIRCYRPISRTEAVAL